MIALPVTLVTGGSAGAREAAIAAMITSGNTQHGAAPTGNVAIILEGMPDGADRFATISPHRSLSIARIAPGCPCCIGNLTMRVTLNRILRHPPEKLYVSLALSDHLEQVRAFLMQQPYNNLLTLTKDIHV